MTPSRPAPGLVAATFGAMALLGVALLTVPALIRDIQAAFGQDDAGMALAYLANSVLYVGGSLAVGLLSRRVPRRAVVTAGPVLLVAGFAGMAVAPGWPAFLVAFGALGAGAGLVDAGMNALVIDLYPGRPAMLGRLHLAFAVGALTVPLLVGAAASASVPWELLVLGLALAGVPILAALAARRDLPPAHPPHAPSPLGDPSRPSAPAGAAGRLALAVLAVAIGAYVAAELGLSSWLVRFLDDLPVQLATLSLSLFWMGLAAGRLLASLVGDRVRPVPFTAACGVLLGLGVIAGVALPEVGLRMAAFAVAGVAAGPIFPMIMAIGAAVRPGRASQVSSVLTAAAISGTIVYPPLMGLVSEAMGLAPAMIGVGLFGFVSAGAVLVAGRVAARPTPRPGMARVAG